MQKIAVALVSMAIFVAGSALAATEKSNSSIVYRWTDESGSVHYSPTKPWGVNYESVDTNYTAVQREMIEESKKAKEAQDMLSNRNAIKNKKEKEYREKQQRLQLCIDTTYDKMSYQKRRIEDDNIKQKLDCEYKFSRAKQKAKFDDCILRIESDRIAKISQLEQNINRCIDADTPKEMIEEVMAKHREMMEKKNAESSNSSTKK